MRGKPRIFFVLCGVYTDSGSFDLHLDANEIRWYEI